MNNQQTKPLKLDFKKLALIAIVAVVAGYQWYAEYQSSDAPQLVVNEPGDQVASDPTSAKSSGTAIAEKREPHSTTSSLPPQKEFLLPGRGKNLVSPAGLIYTASRTEHRRDHVLRHAHDIPGRSDKHGVFDAQGDDVFRLLDEAYELIKERSDRVQRRSAGDGKTEFVINMNRRVGYLGGQPGERKNHPPLYKVKMILGENRVITAFPY